MTNKRVAGPLLTLLLCAFGPPRLGDRLQTPDFEVQRAQLQAVEQSIMPSMNGKAALLLDFDSNRILYDKAAHQELPPASTTKIMTALLTLERGRLDEQVTISALAANTEGTSMGLKEGERLTIRELLFGLLLPSGNDAAVALAQHQAGSVPAFAARMNARAQQLGLTELHFVNAHGLDDPQHLVSAYDIGELARFTYTTQALFREIVTTQHVVLPANAGHPAFDLTNLNQLLGSYPGADGIKTGTTPAAGQNLVGSASQRGHRLIVVVYGSSDRYADARAILDTGFRSYGWFNGSEYFPPGSAVNVRKSADILLPLWESGEVEAFVEQDAGVVHFTVFGRELTTSPVDTG